MVYAYVQNENCGYGRTAAELPGAEVDGKPVARHGDYTQWTLGKRATLAIVADPKVIGYRGRAAYAVAELLDWMPRD